MDTGSDDTADVGKIDVHHHLEWEGYISRVRDAGIVPAHGSGFPDWSPGKSIELMDRDGIRAAILSLSSPGVYFEGTTFAEELAHECNDYAATLVGDRPDRFGFFATLPMPLVEPSIREAARALDELEADGIGLLASSGDKFLGDPDFEELMAELDRRHAVVFIHPNIHSTSERLGLPMPGFLTEFLFDTTRAVTNLVWSGTMERHPRIRWILPHAGGTVPFIAWRLSLANMQSPDFIARAPRGFLAYLREFYYDTALSTSSFAMTSLRELVDPSRILFGSDFPYAPAQLVSKEIEDLRGLPQFDEAERVLIDSKNALELFPRFKPTGASVSEDTGAPRPHARREGKLPLVTRLALALMRSAMGS